MKTFLVLFSLLLVTSCGDKDTTTINNPPPVVINKSIINDFVAVNDGLHGITNLNYSTVTLGVQYDVSEACPYGLGNVGNVGPEEVEPNNSLIAGSSDQGIIQFGHLGYVKSDGSFDATCRALSKERYTYKITGDILTLCMVNYAYCADYKAQ